MKASFTILCCTALTLTSCIGKKDFTIRTTPVEGAMVTINGEPMEGKTPMTLKISQEKDLGIVVEKPGYEAASATVTTKTSWWMALLWTKSDPRAQYIEENEVTIPMKKIPTLSTYTPSRLPSWKNEHPDKSRKPIAPPLRPMPPF